MGTNQIVNDDNYTNNMEFECCPECGHGLNKSLNGTAKECPNCNYKSILCVGDMPNYSSFDSKTNSLVNEPDNKPGGLYGWICPKCGAVMSPFVDFCPNCTKRNFEITCTSTGTNIVSDSNNELMNIINSINDGKLPPLNSGNIGLHTHNNEWT